jgi:hypothetical protein
MPEINTPMVLFDATWSGKLNTNPATENFHGIPQPFSGLHQPANVNLVDPKENLVGQPSHSRHSKIRSRDALGAIEVPNNQH